jgi:glycosyltransferase involved in cell wall biosynthesis
MVKEMKPQNSLRVSVLVTVYNLSKYLRETLDSVVCQDYDNFEVIVVDDASQDDSPEIIQEYMRRYPGKVLGVFNKSNLGISKNSNVALSHATGDLIAMLDGDDLYLPGKISAQVALFNDDGNIVLSYHPGEIFDSATGKLLYLTDQNPKNEICSAEDIITKGGIPVTSSVMIRRSAIPKCGFNEKLPSVNDWWLFIEVGLRGKVVKLNGVYARYRKHGGGISQKSLQLLEESLLTLDLIVEAHPEQPHLSRVCSVGKARYLSGEAYRQMARDPKISAALYKRAMVLDAVRLKYFLPWFFLRYVPFSANIGAFLNDYKYVVKKILSF